MRRARRKTLYRREKDSLKGPPEEAEIQRKALRKGKYAAFSEDTCLEKERVRSKVTPRKVLSGIETERGIQKKEARLEVSLVEIHREEGGLTFVRIERKTLILRPALQSY